MDLIVRNARLPQGDRGPIDIGVADGRIVAMEPDLQADGETLDVAGRLVAPGFVETHIHLDKSCILDRCQTTSGDLGEAIVEVGRLKAGFTAEDVYRRGRRTLEKCILQGANRMRTHVEIDPVVGLRGLEGVTALMHDYRWAIDVEVCVFPQEGLLNNPGTDALLVEALKRGARVVGGAPYTDSDPHGQIDRIFALAQQFDVDIDMHLDLSMAADTLDLDYVCEMTDRYRWGGRVAVGHVTKLAAVGAQRFEAAARRMRDCGVALTVLPSTDLFLMGRDRDHNQARGVAPAHKLLQHGVNCSLSTNNVLNPFTPFGDGSLLRMANLNANICHIGAAEDMRACFAMITERSARLMNAHDYGLAVGKSADFIVLDCERAEEAVAELPPVLYAYKRGSRTVTRAAATLHRPARRPEARASVQRGAAR